MLGRLQDPYSARNVLDAMNNYQRNAPPMPSRPEAAKRRNEPPLPTAATATLVPDHERFANSDAGRTVALGVNAVIDLVDHVRSQNRVASLSYKDAERLVRQAMKLRPADGAAPLKLGAYVSNGTPELIADFIEAPGAGLAELGTHAPVIGPAFGIVKQGVVLGASAVKTAAKVVPIPQAAVDGLKFAGKLSSVATTAAQFGAVGGVGEYARAIRAASAGQKAIDLRNFVDARRDGPAGCKRCVRPVEEVLAARETALAKSAAKANPVVGVAIGVHDAYEHVRHLLKKLTGSAEPSVREGVLGELLTAARDSTDVAVVHPHNGDWRCRVALQAIILLAAQKEASFEEVVITVSAMMLASETSDAVASTKKLLPFMGGEKGETVPRSELTYL